jgi:soluble lytic murein transglycosylase-like protein
MKEHRWAKSRGTRLARRALLAVALTCMPIQVAGADGGPLSPRNCAAYVNEAARLAGLPARWVEQVMRAESAGWVNAISSAGAMGCMQLMPGTWRRLTARHALGSDPFEPRANMIGGALYLRAMHDRFGWPGALAAYNAGPGRYAERLAAARPLPAETRAYVARIANELAFERSVAGPAQAVDPMADWRASSMFVQVGQAANEPSDGRALSAHSADPSRPEDADWSPARTTAALFAVTQP